MKNLFYGILSIYAIDSICGLRILPDVEELIVVSSDNFTLTCIDDSPVIWIYPGKAKGEGIRNRTENGSFICDLTIDSAHFLDTGYFVCESLLDNKKKDRIYVYVFDENNLIALNEPVVIIHGKVNEDMVIPCKPTSPEVNVTLLAVNTEISNLNYDPKVGYTLPTVKVTDSGSLTCEASYHELSTSCTIHLIIDPSANDITIPHIDATGSYHLTEGDNATFNCSSNASVGVKATLDWQLPNDKVKSKVIIEGNREVRHENHRVLYRILSIHNISKDDQGPYTCEVKDENYEIKSSTHFLQIYEVNSTFLNIIVEPESRELTVRAGQPQVRWIANVTAFPRPAITWYNPEGKEIISGISHNGKYIVTNDGQITKLEIAKISIWDFGTYQLRAFNTHRKAAKDFTLIVEDEPVAEIKNDKEFYQYGNTYSVECLLTGYPLPRVTWSTKICQDYASDTCNDTIFESILARNFEEVSMKGYQLKSVYKFAADETRLLKCEASNNLGSSNSTSLFVVTDVADGFAITYDTNLIAVGDDVKITCAASKFTYYDNITWYFVKADDLVPMDHVSGINLMKNETKFSHVATFSISNVQKYHNGKYVCEATLLHRKPAEFARKNITVNVRDVQMPSIVNTNLNSSTWRIVSGKQIELKAFVDGIPEPIIMWFKNGKLLESKQNDTHLILMNRNQTLLITYAAFADEGSYSFVASNKVGNVSAMIWLRLTDKIEGHERIVFIWSFAVLFVVFGFCILCFLIRIQKEKKLRKELAENGLLNFEEGAIDNLNPELGVGDQVDLLPYDKKWEFPRKKLKFGKPLGSGAFGVVMKAEAYGIVTENTWSTVAVKMVKREADSLYIRALASELKIMIHLGQHLNVVNLLGACTKDINKRELMVIVEFCKYGNLQEFLLKQRNNFINQINENGEIDFSICKIGRSNYYTDMTKNGAMLKVNESVVTKETPIGTDGYLINKDNEPDWRTNYCGDYLNTSVAPIKTADLICWSFQIARGMEYLASRKVLHGDLAARNVLLAEGNIVKICDFGLAKSMYANENYQRKKQAPLPIKWMAIESIRDRVFSTQSDVWSFGITVWELFSLSVTPYPDVEGLDKLYNKLLTGYRLEKPDYASEEIYAIMKNCWHGNPAERPTFTELSERFGSLLEEGVQSHYTNLDENVKINAEMTSLHYYQTMLNSSNCIDHEEQRYVNIPCRRFSKVEDEVECEPMLEKTQTEMKNVKPVCFFNQSYADLTKKRASVTYVNSV